MDFVLGLTRSGFSEGSAVCHSDTSLYKVVGICSANGDQMLNRRFSRRNLIQNALKSYKSCFVVRKYF